MTKPRIDFSKARKDFLKALHRLPTEDRYTNILALTLVELATLGYKPHLEMAIDKGSISWESEEPKL